MADRSVPDRITPVVDREIPSAEVLVDLRGRGPVSAAIADLVGDPTLDVKALSEQRAQVKADALAQVAQGLMADPREGPVGVMLVGIGSKEPAVVSDVHVDEVGALVCMIDHPGLPAAYPDGTPVNPFVFVNPPVCVPDPSSPVVEINAGTEIEVPGSKEDPAAAFLVMVAEAAMLAVRRCS